MTAFESNIASFECLWRDKKHSPPGCGMKTSRGIRAKEKPRNFIRTRLTRPKRGSRIVLLGIYFILILTRINLINQKMWEFIQCRALFSITFLQRRFLHGFCSSEKAKKGTCTDLRRKMAKISNNVFLIWVIFLQKRERFAYFYFYPTVVLIVSTFGILKLMTSFDSTLVIYQVLALNYDLFLENLENR